MCGLKRRAEYPEFIDFVKNYDLVCFSESKIDATDIISFPGYCCYDQPRKQNYIRRSGGISVYFDEKLVNYISKIDTDSDYVLWIELSKHLFNLDENVILGAVYILPEGSNFYNDDEFSQFENEITSFCNTHKYVLLSGDFNGRTSTIEDYTECDMFLADLFDFDTDAINFFSAIDRLSDYNILRDRKSMDTHSNNHGYKLIDLCKNHNLFICNGRLDKDRLIGQFTFRKTSVIDYTLGTIDALRLIDQFSIFETDTIYSDGHSILSHAFAPSNSATNEDNHVTGNFSRPKWDDSYSNIFCENIDTEELKSVSSILASTSSAEDRVNRATESIAKLFSDASNRTFPMHNKKKLCQKKPWFGPLCRSARKKYHAAKKYYNSCQSSINMHRLKEASKSYKKTMNKFISKYRKQNENKLRNLQSKKPKQYWNFLNSLKHRSNSNSPSLHEFYEYFRDLNSVDLENADLSDFDYLHSSDENLNKEITYEEVSRCIDRLNNGKASGIDRILNEHIKTTKYTFITIYVKLFNLVLDSGCFPEQWSTGMISPIYKKGDRSNPQNYRPITILSCLG